MYKYSAYNVIERKLFCIIHEICVLSGNISAQYAKSDNWAEMFPLNHKFGTFLLKSMSRLDNYNKKTQESYERFIKSSQSHTYLVSSYNSITEKWEVITRQELEKRQLATFNQIKEYFQSDECNWMNMPSHHPDRKFVNHLRRYCESLKNNEVASDDKTALELIAENLVALDWKTVSETGRLIRSSWTEAELSYEYDGELFRVMAYRILQDVFIKPAREINVVNFSELEPPVDESNRFYRPSSISSVGKRKCRVCGKPAFDDICFEHIK